MGNNRYCVIMAGGIGSRFWPVSRNSHPKQFLDILGSGKTFLQSTYERFLPVIPAENIFVVTNAVYKDLVTEQLPGLNPDNILCEPIGRNTAPCIAYAAFKLHAKDPDATMIVTPSDHLIVDGDKFRNVISEGADFIEEHTHSLMTIGIKPSYPNTGYGYIQIEPECDPDKGIRKVRTFTEKPNLEMATAFVESGEFFWNSGIFIWKTEQIIKELEKSLPETYQLFDSVNPNYNTPAESEDILRIYPLCRAISIDFGVMERADDVYVYCSEFGWSDIGTWGSLYQHSPKDGNGNVVSAVTSLYETNNCIIKAPDEKLVVIEGLSDYIVVDTDDVLMVCPRSYEQNIKKYIEEIKYEGRDKYI